MHLLTDCSCDFGFKEAGPFASDWTAKVARFSGRNDARDFYRATPLPVDHRLNVLGVLCKFACVSPNSTIGN